VPLKERSKVFSVIGERLASQDTKMDPYEARQEMLKEL
jgi:hypothetical protein